MLDNDPCVFYRGITVILVYTNDCLIFAQSDLDVDKCIKDLQKIFDVEDEGSIEEYLGVKVDKLDDGSFHLSQPHLIDSILRDLGLIDTNGDRN